MCIKKNRKHSLFKLAKTVDTGTQTLNEMGNAASAGSAMHMCIKRNRNYSLFKLAETVDTGTQTSNEMGDAANAGSAMRMCTHVHKKA
jgi:hypothetical protein